VFDHVRPPADSLAGKKRRPTDRTATLGKLGEFSKLGQLGQIALGAAP